MDREMGDDQRSGKFHLNGHDRGYATFLCVTCLDRQEKEKTHPPKPPFRDKDRELKPFVAKPHTNFGIKPSKETHKRTMWCSECGKITNHQYDSFVVTESHV